MEKYQGKISGVGNAITRKNEITADDLAISRNYIYGWEYGVINRSGWNFNAYKDGNNIVVEKGIMFAYGYFGIFPETYTIPFIKPSATQYRFIYAEIDRSVVPNVCSLKVKNNQGSDKIKPTTFRQDYLTAIRTGVFQLPLWRVELNSEGVKEVVDVRDLKDYIMKVEHTNATTDKVTGEISLGAKAATQPITDNSEKLATTEFVYLATRTYIDGYSPIEGTVAWKFNLEIQGTNDIGTYPTILIFEKEKSIYKKAFVVSCPNNISVRFSTIENETARIVEEEIVVEIVGDTKYITVPIEVDTLNVNNVEETIIIQQG